MNELDLLRNLAEQLRYYARHGIVDASQDINEDLYNWLQEYEEVRKENKQEVKEKLELENNGC